MRPPNRPAPMRYGSRYGSDADTTASTATGRPCPLCQTGTVSPRARYCSDACKQRAYRLRRANAAPVNPATLTADLQRRQARVAQTVYECPTCEARFLGERRCPDCHVFCRRLGLGGLCPHCDDPVTLAELLGSEEVPPTR
jgi:hypothetical protein